MVRLRGGLEDHMHPKFWHWQKGAGALASAPCQDFFGGFVHNALRALQSDQKVIISPHFRTFAEKCCESHLRAFVGQIRQCQDFGCQPTPDN